MILAETEVRIKSLLGLHRYDPRLYTHPSETVEVRLAFTKTARGTPVAIAVQGGGALQAGKHSAALSLEADRQVAFAFTVSSNVGMHRVSITAPSGELKPLEFWAGSPPVLPKERSPLWVVERGTPSSCRGTSRHVVTL